MTYCINPNCQKRDNSDTSASCENCGTPLTLNNRFKLIAPLDSKGERAQSQVFSVEDLSRTDHQQVLKAVWKTRRIGDEKEIELFQRESRILPFLAHPGIPKADLDNYFEVSTAEGKTIHCMVMDFVEGQNLADWINENQPISNEQALNWLQQLANIIHTFHPQGIFHRDIKPDNIILKPNGELVLIDFGSVREITQSYLNKLSIDPSEMGTDASDYQITRIYTFGYAPPEQINGMAITQSDFFALGRTIVHAVTGIHPKHLPEDEDTAKLIWRDKAPQISGALATYIDKLIERAPRKRPLNTEWLIQDLNELIPKKIKRDRIIKSKWFRISCLATAALVLIGGTWVLRGWWTDNLLKSADQNLKEGNNNEATKDFKLAIKLNPQNYLPYNGLASICFQERDMECAFQYYKKELERRPEATKWLGYANLGRLYDEIDEYKQAKDAYLKAIKLTQGKAAFPINNLARIEILDGDASSAKQRLLPLLERDLQAIDFILVLKNLGWAELELKQYSSAQKYLTEAINIQNEAQKTQSNRVISPADPHCILLKVQEQLGTFQKETRRNCLIQESETPESHFWKLQYIDRISNYP